MDSIVIHEENICYTVSTDRKNLIKYHWHNGDIANLPHTIEAISPFALANMRRVKTVILPLSLKSIGKGAFCECSSLQSIVFLNPKQKLIVGKYAFWKCYSLDQINLPKIPFQFQMVVLKIVTSYNASLFQTGYKV